MARKLRITFSSGRLVITGPFEDLRNIAIYIMEAFENGKD